jgi:hypothetical protein
MSVNRRSVLTGGITVSAAAAAAQSPVGGLPDSPLNRDRDVKLPSGKSQRDEILKADHERNIEDARALAKLTGDISSDIEKSDRFILPVATLRKLDEAEKLVKKIRGRLRRY